MKTESTQQSNIDEQQLKNTMCDDIVENEDNREEKINTTKINPV